MVITHPRLGAELTVVGHQKIISAAVIVAVRGGVQYRLKLLHAEPAQPQSIPKRHKEPPATESDAAENTAKRSRLE